MKTARIYFEDTYRFSDVCKVLASGKDEDGFYVILDRTIFHPQGGGQPSDQGVLQNNHEAFPIQKVKTVSEEIRHYLQEESCARVNQEYKCMIKSDMRLAHAKLHTGGHLLSHIVEKLYPSWNAVKGHHFPGECYVEFTPCEEKLEDINPSSIQEALDQAIHDNSKIVTVEVKAEELLDYCPYLDYEAEAGSKVRLTRIGDFPYLPCGGTHLSSLKELRGMKILKTKVKKGTLKVYYDYNE